MSDKVQKEYFSISEVATIFGMSQATIRRNIDAGSIKTVKVLGNIRIHIKEIERLKTA